MASHSQVRRGGRGGRKGRVMGFGKVGDVWNEGGGRGNVVEG